MHASMSDLSDVRVRADALAGASLFASWPGTALLRLAHASVISTHARGDFVVTAGPANSTLAVVVGGTALACVTRSDGRRVTFKIATGTSVHGVVPFVEAGVMTNDVIAADPVSLIRIPHAALRVELRAAPILWESVAMELATRARGYIDQVESFVFDPPRVHLAALLTDLVRSCGGDAVKGQPVPIGQRLPQELIAEMLGISRQWASTVIREMVDQGLVRWRYGRVTVLDTARLRAISDHSIHGPR